MARLEYTIESVLNIPLWEKMQDKLAELTGTAIICIDIKGNPVTKHSGRTEFCSIIRENPVSRKRCFRCDALAGVEAVRRGRPYIYLCHCGIVDVAVPIMVGDIYLGAVMFGQVRLLNKDREKAVRLVNEISSFQTEEDSARQEMLKKYELLPEMDYDRIVQIADFISSVVQYTIDRSVKSNTCEKTYHWLLSRHNETSAAEPEIQELYAPRAAADTLSEQLTVKQDSVLYPAIMYIHNHPGEAISQKDMATLCHLSPSYFSRRFSRETGENFVSYVNRLKIERAKELLRSTNRSIAGISAEVGFLNANNFIAVFKRYEDVTPSLYRQYFFK